MLKRCPNCGLNRLVRRSVDRVRHVAGHAFTMKLPVEVCSACGESYFDDEVVADFDLRVADRLAGSGVTDPDALKFMRKVTGLQGKEFAELLQVRPETVSRWEQGKRPIDRASYAVIHQLIADRLQGTTSTADFLRSLRKPKRLPKKVMIALPTAA